MEPRASFLCRRGGLSLPLQFLHSSLFWAPSGGGKRRCMFASEQCPEVRLIMGTGLWASVSDRRIRGPWPTKTGRLTSHGGPRPSSSISLGAVVHFFRTARNTYWFLAGRECENITTLPRSRVTHPFIRSVIPRGFPGATPTGPFMLNGDLGSPNAIAIVVVGET